MGEWGKKPTVENDLDHIINNDEKALELKFTKYPKSVYEFAKAAKTVTKKEAKEFVLDCSCYFANATVKREDVFYIIDHTNLTMWDKLTLKLEFLFQEVL